MGQKQKAHKGEEHMLTNGDLVSVHGTIHVFLICPVILPHLVFLISENGITIWQVLVEHVCILHKWGGASTS